MEKMKIEIEVAKDLAEVCDALGALSAALIVALKDKKIDSVDLAALMAVAVSKAGPAIDGLSNVLPEIKEDPSELIKALDLMVVQPIVKALFLKVEVLPVVEPVV